MRRINSVLTVAAIRAAMLIGSAGPALANHEHYLETPDLIGLFEPGGRIGYRNIQPVLLDAPLFGSTGLGTLGSGNGGSLTC